MTVTNKGSQWQRCDLQIQTILDDRYLSLKSYYSTLKASSGAKWAEFVGIVGGEENALLFDSKEYYHNDSITKKERATNHVRTVFAFLQVYNPELTVIGVTDHNYYDNILLDEFVQYSLKGSCKVIPGVEINVAGVHILVYFNTPPFGKSSFSDGIKTFLSKIGIDVPKSSGVLKLSDKGIFDVIKIVKEQGGFYLFPHCNSNNGLFQERGKTDRTHLSDIFNYKKRIVLQAKSYKAIKIVRDYIQSNAIYLSKAIYTISSDSRSLRDYGVPDEDGNALWIKSLPSFEGIKQLLYEPDSRIHIGPSQPEIKEGFSVIDSVQFITPEGDNTFPPHPIHLNPNLNSIIGGKSSGKSLLLTYIARAIDEAQTNDKRRGLLDGVDYNFEKELENFDFKVTWRDGVEYKLSEEISAKNRLISYIPQMHINVLAERKGKEELNSLITNFLNENTAYKEFYDTTSNLIREINLKISNEINAYYNKRREIDQEVSELKKLGDKQGYLMSIEKKTADIVALKTKAEFRDEEERIQYENLVVQNERLLSRKKRVDTAVEHLLDYSKLNEQQSVKMRSEYILYKSAVSGILSYDIHLGKSMRDMIADDIEEISLKFSDIKSRVDHKVDKLRRLSQLIANATDETLRQLQPFFERNQFTQLISLLVSEIDDLQTKIDAINKCETIVSLKTVELLEIKNNIFDYYSNLFDQYVRIQTEVNKEIYSKIYPEEEIILTASVEFNQSAFGSFVFSQLNKKGYLNKWLGLADGIINDDNNYIFSPAYHVDSFQQLFEKFDSATHEDHRFNSGRTSESLNKDLLKDYFYVNYTLKQKREDILLMSPGKKGIILLILILKLSNAKHPILIDQPEDNLDNRTIYSKLKEFIKNRKKERQIIMVTHNANMVVPTDSENIIVANQSGQDKGKDNSQYRFDYINGALEESFTMGGVDILRSMGIREHVCDILEGGEEAFLSREDKYSLKRK